MKLQLVVLLASFSAVTAFANGPTYSLDNGPTYRSDAVQLPSRPEETDSYGVLQNVQGAQPMEATLANAVAGTPVTDNTSAAACAVPAAPDTCINFWQNYQSSSYGAGQNLTKCAVPADANESSCASYNSCLLQEIAHGGYCGNSNAIAAESDAIAPATRSPASAQHSASAF